MELSSTCSDESGSVLSGISGIEPLNYSGIDSSSHTSPTPGAAAAHWNDPNIVLVIDHREKAKKKYIVDSTARLSAVTSGDKSVHELKPAEQLQYTRPKGARVQLFREQDITSAPSIETRRMEQTKQGDFEIVSHDDEDDPLQDTAAGDEPRYGDDGWHPEQPENLDDEDVREDGTEPIIGSPNFLLRPVMHDDVSTAQRDSGSSEEEDSMYHPDPSNHEGVDPETRYSDNTEADQYVMHPEADQSEIGIQIAAAEGQSEPRPMAVGQTTHESEYQAAGSASEDEDDNLSQSDMPEDTYNFVSRQIEGEDEDDEDGSSVGVAGGYAQPQFLPTQNGLAELTNNLHSPLHSSQNLSSGPVSQTSPELQRHDLAHMPQRVPPSGAADLSQLHIVATSTSAFRPIANSGGSRASSRTSHTASRSIQHQQPAGAQAPTPQVPTGRNGPAGAQANSTLMQSTTRNVSTKNTSDKGDHKSKIPANKTKRSGKMKAGSSSMNSNATQHGTRAHVDERPVTSGSSAPQPHHTQSLVTSQPGLSSIPSASQPPQQGRPIMGTLTLKPESVTVQHTPQQPAMTGMNFVHDSTQNMNPSQDSFLHHSQQQQQHHQQQQAMATQHHQQHQQHGLSINTSHQITAPSWLQQQHHHQQQQQQPGPNRLLNFQPAPQVPSSPPRQPSAPFTYPAPSLEHPLEMSPVSYAGSHPRGGGIQSPGTSSVFDMLHNTSMTSTRSYGPSQSGGGQDISNIEQVRGQLQDMLRLTGQALPDKLRYDESERRETDAMDSVLGMSDMTSQLEDLLSFTSRQLGTTRPQAASQTHNRPHDVPSLLADNHALMQTLEQEKYRRKHCEKQIQDLQNKMLELQQQLAVAVSTDRKKDLMIEQLDKNLAKVMDGWKRKESEREERIVVLTEENTKLNTKESQHVEMLGNLKRQLSGSVAELQKEREQSVITEAQQNQVIEQLQAETQSLKSTTHQQKIRISALEKESAITKESNMRLSRQLDELREQYEVERETWEEKEQEYAQKVEEITENHLSKMDENKVRLEEQVSQQEDTVRLLSDTQNSLHSHAQELEAALREKESLKVEIGIVEAKAEASLRTLESELQAKAERAMCERLEEIHTRYSQQEDTARDRHRHQMQELNQHHAHEMQQQLARFHDDAKRQEDKWRVQVEEYDERITSLQEDLHLAREHNQTLDVQRQEITNKLQEMMQSHCNETLRLLQLGSVALPLHKAMESVVYTSSGGSPSSSQTVNSSATSTQAPVIHPQVTMSQQMSGPSAGSVSWEPTKLTTMDSTSPNPSLTSYSLPQPLSLFSSHPLSSPTSSSSAAAAGFSLSDSIALPMPAITSCPPATTSSPSHPSLRTNYTQPSHHSLFTSSSPISSTSASSAQHLFSQDRDSSILLHPPVDLSVSGGPGSLDASSLSTGSAQDDTVVEGQVVRDKFTLSLMESLGTTNWNPAQAERHLAPRAPSGFLSSILQQDADLTPTSVRDGSPQQPEKLLGAMEERFEQHEQRQTELQHYIRKLLERSRAETAGAASSQPPSDQGPPEPPREQKTKHVAFSKTAVVMSDPPAPYTQPTQSPPTNQQGVSEVLSPEQAGEISRLLGLYRGPLHGQQGAVSGSQGEEADLYSYLQTLQTRNEVIHSGSNQSTPTRDVPRDSASPPRSIPSMKEQGQNKVKRHEGTYQVSHQHKQAIRIPTGDPQATSSVASSKPRQTNVNTSRTIKQPHPKPSSAPAKKADKKPPPTSVPDSKPAGKGVPKWK